MNSLEINPDYLIALKNFGICLQNFEFSEFSDDIENKNSELKFDGELNFHGIKLNIDIAAEAIQEKNNLILKGNFDLALSDFEVPLPSFMLRKMEDEIEIKFELYYRKLDR